MNKVTSPIIVALDFDNYSQALSFAEALDPTLCRVKVGKELFTAAGPAIVEALQKKNFDVFLDLKFYDIPTTVAKACKVVAQLGAWMLTLHCTGGLKMLSQAVESLVPFTSKPLLIGVTVLTSFSEEDLRALHWPETLEKNVLNLAQLAYEAGLNGIVSSAHETATLKKHFPQNFTFVTPGIRLESDPKDDQKRTKTPHQAIEAGSDYLVIGRPITQAKDPLLALENIIASLSTTTCKN